ncbi:hypothetical protein KSP39_PZI024216 [Platanthera zijinensis]|uniref:Uncharacterized protein n=1 Tax=Platanthera zijinensis TaxID=2320716 RepID=A0AAP0ASW8_9ASPA
MKQKRKHEEIKGRQCKLLSQLALGGGGVGGGGAAGVAESSGIHGVSGVRANQLGRILVGCGGVGAAQPDGILGGLGHDLSHVLHLLPRLLQEAAGVLGSMLHFFACPVGHLAPLNLQAFQQIKHIQALRISISWIQKLNILMKRGGIEEGRRGRGGSVVNS